MFEEEIERIMITLILIIGVLIGMWVIVFLWWVFNIVKYRKETFKKIRQLIKEQKNEEALKELTIFMRKKGYLKAEEE